MLGSYTNTINNFLRHSYEEIKETSDDDLRVMLKSLGLPDARIKFIRSMSRYIDNNLKSKDIKSIPNGVLIADIAKNVIKSDNAVFYTQRDITVELCPLIVG